MSPPMSASTKTCHEFDNTQQAHDDLIGNGYVNFNTPSQSRISQQIAGGHNGINPALSNDLTEAVANWGNHR